MRITESQLRRIVRRMLNEQAMSPMSPLQGGTGQAGHNPEVDERIRHYASSQGKKAWDMVARDHFVEMAAGGNPEYVRTDYYPSWSNENFQTVLDALG